MLLQPGKALTVIMMEGLQGAGKTTTAAKLAGKFKLKGKKVLLTACDIYRPGAIEQLQINGEKQGVEVFSMGDKIKPVNIAKAAIEHAAKNEFNIVILDTAGRLHIDDDMMAELQEIKENVTVHQTVLVVDAMTGQDAVNVAKMFDEKVGIDGEKKVNLTGSVASVSSSEIKDRVQTNVLSAVQGTVPGVTVISRPGSTPSINFRGRGNLGTSEPLYVIDGAIADAAFFQSLNPNSIESISFLKDASSSAIYGSRAAYGVVLVTTKNGEKGKMNVSYR